MAKLPPPRTQTRKADVVAERTSRRPLAAKPADPRQASLFEAPLPKWNKPCLPTLADKPHGYRVSIYVADGKATIRTRRRP